MFNSLLSLYIAGILGLDVTSQNAPTAGGNHALLASATVAENQQSNPPPLKDSIHISPVIGAKGIIATDLKTGTTLFEKNPDQRLKIASITKLMTLLIILEENQLDEVVTISGNADSAPGSTMFLKRGEQITVENLIYGALINSANDAAVALAEHNANSVDAFVIKMNNKAKDLGLSNSHFSNPVGLDDSANYSSARDIANLGTFLYRHKLIKKLPQ